GQVTGLPDLLAVAVDTARAAGAVARRHQGDLAALTVEHKSGPSDLVSQADREAEQAARAVLADRRPDDAVVGEESAATDGTSGVAWHVDPIDGTTNYLYGRDDWCVSVAAWQDGRALVGVVLEPVTDRLTTATAGGGAWCRGVRLQVRRPSSLEETVVELGLGRASRRAAAGRVFGELVPRVRDVRRGGSAAIALANVALGRADAVWSPGLQTWDLAAGVLLVVEAGGVVHDLDGAVDGMPASGEVLAGDAATVARLRPLLQAAYG
ncbi:MAG: hypothetical protein JWN17_2162, partial [Frankiales bacterium]|nr:hypothetical protein [Frankiales bacterium]